MKEFRKTKDGLFICEECEKVCNTKMGLSQHIRFNHKNTEEYYHKWLKDGCDGFCKICNKETEFISVSLGYKNCCSLKCNKLYNVLRSKEEMLKKYGNISYNNNEKHKQTCLKKYGDENYHNMEQTKQTNLEKYGVEYTFQNEEIKEKGKQTCLLKYGFKNAYQVEEFKEKSKQTKKEKYGNENYRNDDKIKKTCIERYGCENPSQNKDIFEKTQKSGFKARKYKDTNLYYRGSLELDFLEKYFPLFPDIINGPTIKYIFEENQHFYFPDFYIPSLNLIVEIKYSYYANRDKNKIEAKKKATIANGFNYIMIIDKNYINFDQLIK